MSTKIAVITGSSSGIGLLTTVELAKSGFQVIATMRELARREKLEQAASSAGVRPYIDARRLDVTEFDLIQPFVEKLVRDHGRIDLLVNNAGFAVAGFAEDLTVGEIRSQFETNFSRQVAMTKAVLPTMRQQRSGHITMVSSTSGLHGPYTIRRSAARRCGTVFKPFPSATRLSWHVPLRGLLKILIPACATSSAPTLIFNSG